MPLPSFKKPTKETSRRMRKVLRKGTDIERTTALILRRARVKFRSQPKVKGNPDFRVLGTKIVIFCDSSFWHGRWVNTPKAEKFHKNHDFWHAKLLRNRSRDRRVSRDLKKRGWVVLRFWDEDILEHPQRVVLRVSKAIKVREFS